ncbi:MAG: YetF domain-containing protein, partial [Chloroflexota bacterium]
AQGMVALAALFRLQWCVSFLVARSGSFESFIMDPSSVLVRNGQVDRHRLRAERLSSHQLRQSIREQGHDPEADLALVRLESSGTISVLATMAGESRGRTGDQ